MQKYILEEIYRSHHNRNHREGFSFFEKQRAQKLAKLIGRGKKILDLGCRDGTLTKYFAKGNEILGVDIDKKMLLKCHSSLGIPIMQFDLNSTTWPFKKNYFDVVVAGEILEHLFNPEMVVSKIRLLLKDGGIFVGSVPNTFHFLDRIGFIFGKIPRGYADPTHVNMFSKKSLENLLSQYFSKTLVVPITVDKFSFLAKIFPSLLADDYVFFALK